MQIHRYQIDNVLDVYRRQLGRSASRPKKADDAADKAAGQVQLSSQARRQAIFERVTDDILRKITRFEQILGPLAEGAGMDGAVD